MFQKTSLYGIEVDPITQSLWSELKKNLIGLNVGTHIVIGRLVAHHDTIF
jgi:hypothetical protein